MQPDDSIREIAKKTAKSIVDHGSVPMATLKESIILQEKVDELLAKENDVQDTVKAKAGRQLVIELPAQETVEIPEFPTDISINNLPEVQMVEVLNFPEQKAPVVNVKAPIVNVDAPIINLDNEEVKDELIKANDTLTKIEEALTKEEEEKIEKVTLVDQNGDPFEIKIPESTGGRGFPIDYATATGQAYDPVNKKVIVGNAKEKFRDGFVSYVTGPDPSVYDIVDTSSGNFIVNTGGNAVGSSYVRISMDPINPSGSYSFTTKQTFQFPFNYGVGISASQRVNGQEFAMEFVGVDVDNTVQTNIPVADVAITGATISIASNVGTVTATNHGLKGGDRIIITGCADSAMNVGPVQVASVLSSSQFTVSITIADASYSSVGGIIKRADPTDNAKNVGALLFDGTTTTTAQFVTRRNGDSPRQLASTIATTTAAQTSTSPYTDAFNTNSVHELTPKVDSLYYRSFQADSRSAGISGSNRYSQSVPDEEYYYKLRIRAKNHANFNVPVAKIASIAKTGTTTATVTTASAHGLTSADRVAIWGVRDLTSFPNLTARTSITVLNATQFTIVIGAALTITDTNGGVVVKMNGNSLDLTASGYFGQSIQSISRTANEMTVVGNTTWTTPLPGEYVHIYGVNAAASAYEGAYKVLRVNTTSLILESTGADFGSITTGGAVIRRTDVRVHFMRCLSHTRLETEIVGGRGDTSDLNDSVPIVGTVSVNSQTSQTSTALITASDWSGNQTTDVTSAALTTTTTTSAITPHYIGQKSFAFQFVVTSVTGTSPTLDMSIEESLDAGTNWDRIYDMPRITAAGSYTTPRLKPNGNRIRYVQTVTGTSPSFTRAVNRLTYSTDELYKYRFIDRTIAPNTLNSTTPARKTEGATSLQVVISSGAVTTSAATFTIEGSMDNLIWYSVGTTMSPAANTAASQTIARELSRFIRVKVTTAGVGQTLNYVDITAYEN